MEQHELASPPNKKSNHGLARIRRRVRGILSARKLLCVASYALLFWLSLFRPDFVVAAFRSSLVAQQRSSPLLAPPPAKVHNTSLVDVGGG